MDNNNVRSAARSDRFRLVTYSSGSFEHPGLAVASARAGAIACVDCEFATDQQCARHLEQLITGAPDRELGIRFGRRKPGDYPGVLALLAALDNISIVVGAAGEQPLHERLAAIPRGQARRVFVEIIDVQDLGMLSGLAIDAVIGVGNEAGGFVGEDSSFILFQKLRMRCQLPIFVRGGVGVNNSAAFRVAGAAGVVLEEQLLLLKESPLPLAWRSELAQTNGQDTRILADREQYGRCRVLIRPTMTAARALEARTTDLETRELNAPQWIAAAAEAIGWNQASEKAWPVGQCIGLAKIYRSRYRSCGRLLSAIELASIENIRGAAILQPLREGAPLAVSHGTRYPIVQGPMTRVSDNAQFAKAVAEGGGLPFLALALMREQQVVDLLRETKELLGDLPWGVGLLGFVPHQLRQEQIEALWKVPPDFALIAGGRPDQAIEFEQRGVPAYIHVPVPELLKIFLEQGARRFVFEGRECGGHIGPLASSVLWESMVEALLEEIPPGAEQDVHVLFAGGLHDATTGAMLSALTAPLAARGVRVGALMGSAYLFTHELVESGAAVPGFQEAALQCARTCNLETGVGHVTRCAATPFCDEFFERRVALLKGRAAAEDIREELEDLNLGRLRIAAKGQDRRGPDGAIVAITEAEQALEGMYMIGQVATLRSERLSIRALHEDFATRSLSILQAANVPAGKQRRTARPADVAIIGIGTLLPGAQHPEEFWENLVNLKSAIREIPLERWDWRLYFDEDRQKPDRIYSRWGGFLDEVRFDPLSFGIPPKSLKSIDPLQLLSLEVVRRALADAGFTKADYDRDDTSVILGASGGLGDLGLQYGMRSELLRFVDNLPEEVWGRLPEWTEESFAGTLLNVIAGRIANRFNFGGLNFTVDAACASSLAAINLAVNELVEGRSYVAIAGGVDTVQSPFGYMCFCKTQALSPKGKARTFDSKSDGIVISEGLATVVLKRLADAERDGDRVYAVIKAVGGSSDGKALGLTAPLPEGQMRALHRAYEQAGFSPATLGLVEAHGTGTVVGDRAEAETIVRVLRQADTSPKACAIGSLKTLLGHTKAAAGVTGLVKVALSLYHQVLPGHAGVESPIEIVGNELSPVYLLTGSRPWFKPAEHPRRGAVSSFGFGGTNFHAVLEEYSNGYLPQQGTLGARAWPCELLTFGAADLPQLLERVRHLQSALEAGAQPPLRDLAYSLALQESARGRQDIRLAIVAADVADLRAKLAQAGKMIEAGTGCPPGGDIQFLAGGSDPGKVAFLFPGQGAQYPNMCRELALYLPEFRNALEHADSLFGNNAGLPLSRIIYPCGAFTEEAQKRQWDALTDTKVAQPAIGAISAGCLDFVGRLGLRADMVAGHSFGEYSALHAAGYLDRTAFYTLAAIRGRTMAEACNASPSGGMAAVTALRDDVSAALRDYPGLVVANHNATRQVVISGPADALDAAIRAYDAKAVAVRRLPVAGAFHSPLVATAQAALSAAIAATELHTPSLPVYGNRDGRVYPQEASRVRDILSAHMLSPVEFVAQLQAMHDAGARVFVEVGPKNLLCGLTGQTLEGREYSTIALDSMRGSLRGCLASLAKLYTLGVPWSPAALFAGRDCQTLDLRNLERDWRPAIPGKTDWYVTGGGTRAPGEVVVKTGKLPALTLETTRAAAAARDAAAPRLDRAPAPAATPASIPTATAVASSVPVEIPRTAHADGIAPPPVAAPVLADPGGNRIGGDVANILAGYHQTMQEFLRVQENIVVRFLGASQGSAAGQHAPPAHQTGANYAIPAARQAPVGRPVALAPTPQAQPVPPPLQAAASASVSSGPAAVESPAPAAMDRAALTRMLLEVISDRTGYPEEMLGLELDLEAELGVDSIKRVEILGALQQRLPEGLARGLQATMETLTRLKTLAALLDALASTSTGQAASPAVAIAGAPPILAAAPAAMDRAALTRMLLEVISDRTGYPEEMLGLELDLEAELGVDSIKRVEILGALQQRLPEGHARDMQAQMETLTRLKTLAALLDKLMQPSTPASPTLETTSAARQEPPDRPEERATLPTFIMQGEARALPLARHATPSGLVLITGAKNTELSRELCQRLTEAGAHPVVVDREATTGAAALKAWLEAQRRTHGAVRGLIHLSPLEHVHWPDDVQRWRELSEYQVKSFFSLLQACLPDLRTGGNGTAPKVLAAIAIDGHFGRSGQCTNANPLGGAITGLFKTLAWEVPGVRVRMLDVAQSLDESAKLSAIFDEYRADHDDIEVGYDGRNRTVYYPQQIVDCLARPAIAPDPSWVVLVTGGARGITNHVAREVLRPGMRLVVVGRTPPPEAESAATANLPDNDRAAFRAQFVAAAKASRSKTNPAEIEAKIDALLRDREIRHNLRELPKSGVTCEYRACDVTDPQQFGALIEGIYERFGRLDAVFHGAGCNEDKLIEDKTLESFARIFDTKADSAFILSRHLRPEGLRLLIFFTSVAGRFGNRGQADYAAANEVVNRVAWTLGARWPHTAVYALNWGPWDNTGMVTEEIKRQFKARGIEAITPEQGRRWIAGLFSAGGPLEVELIIGAGPWATMTAAPTAVASPHQPRLVLIDELPAVKPNGSLVVTHSFSAESDPYLVDHRLDGRLVLPATGAAEWFAQVVQAGWPDWQVAEVRDLSVLKGFTFNPDESRVASFVARPSSHASADELHVNVEMRDNDKQSVHYRGTVILRRALPLPVPARFPVLESGITVSAEQAYSEYLFHGPSFRLICDSAIVSKLGVDASAMPSTPAAWLNGRTHGDAQAWLLDPGLLDTAPQLAIIWSRMQFDETALPSRIGGIRRFGGWLPNGRFRVALRVAPGSSAGIFKYDVDFALDDGTVALQMEGVESSRSAALNRLAAQHEH